MKSFNLDIVVTRGGVTESHHAVHAALVRANGTLAGTARDAGLVTFWRSCAKPFQVMPLVESGGFDQVGWGDDELTIACASHGGEPEHVTLVERMLRGMGLEEGDLACGPAEPLAARGARIVRDAGVRPSRLHNNCSGKHTAMLAAAKVLGVATKGYEKRDHDVQRACTGAVAVWTGVPAGSLIQAVDGCGVVCYGLPLQQMARSYARFARAACAGNEVPSRIVHAVRTRPQLLGGTDRFDTILLEETDGRVFAKVGAEGVHTVAVLDDGLGFAVKVEDGTPRAQYAAVLRLLQLVGAIPDPAPDRLAEFLVRPVRNTRGEVVGEVRPAA